MERFTSLALGKMAQGKEGMKNQTLVWGQKQKTQTPGEEDEHAFS